jgi:hypothetical protein
VLQQIADKATVGCLKFAIIPPLIGEKEIGPFQLPRQCPCRQGTELRLRQRELPHPGQNPLAHRLQLGPARRHQWQAQMTAQGRLQAVGAEGKFGLIQGKRLGVISGQRQLPCQHATGSAMTGIDPQRLAQ